MDLCRTFPLVLLTGMSFSVAAQQTTLRAGTPLHVQLDRATRIHPGAKLHGHLTEPLFAPDHEVVPKGSLVTGRVQGTRPGSRRDRIQRLLAADFTPPRIPEVVFESIQVPAQESHPQQVLTIEAPGQVTSADVLTLGTHRRKQSIRGRPHSAVAQNVQELKDSLHKRYLTELVEKWAVGQLPYHPDILWSKTHFNADLRSPVQVDDGPHPSPPVQDLQGRLPQGTLVATLLSPLSSATAKHGDPVQAEVTEPLFTADHTTLLVPAGTPLLGTVVQSRPARRFGRNGSLRFSFNRLELSSASQEAQPLHIHGRLTAAATASGEHVVLDEEGQTRAADGPAKVAEPALLAVLAVASAGDGAHPENADVGSSTVSSNGFGLIARVVSLSTRSTNVVQGFAYYALAKSLYYRWIAKGHETTFDHDTPLRVTLSAR